MAASPDPTHRISPPRCENGPQLRAPPSHTPPPARPLLVPGGGSRSEGACVCVRGGGRRGSPRIPRVGWERRPPSPPPTHTPSGSSGATARAPCPPTHTPSHLSTRRELRLRNPRPRPGGWDARGGARRERGPEDGRLGAPAAPSCVPAVRETWKPKIKVKRGGCPAPGVWASGWALSLGCLGSDPAGAAAARRRDLGSEPQPPTSDSSAPRLPPKAGPWCALPGSGGREDRARGCLTEPEPSDSPGGGGGAASVPPGCSERARWPRRAGGLCPLSTGTEEHPEPGLHAARGEGPAPAQSSKRLIRAAYPTEWGRIRERISRGICVCV